MIAYIPELLNIKRRWFRRRPPAATGAPGVVIQVDDNYGSFTPPAANTDRVRAHEPRGANAELFGRPKVLVP